MRFGLLFALAATSTSAVQINVATVKESSIGDSSIAPVKLDVNKTRIKELADAEIKDHIKKEEQA
tara:strand:+ start:77 stop:271 length:195 start_codon:yes stop_codon:yes gene_type:complete